MAVMETLFAWPQARRALKASQCSTEGCNESVDADLGSRPLCLHHFLSVSIEEVGKRSSCLNMQPFDAGAVDAFRKFLSACEEQAALLSERPDLSDPSAKNRLVEIRRLVSQWTRRLRRSPRVTASVPVWLRREDPRHTWEEETWTSTVSRHGAGFECRHSVDVNGTVVLCRRDRGSRAQARVVYSRFDAEGRRHIGVELIDPGDFWGLAETASSSLQISSVAP
jgi:hypothetical protein